MYFVGFKFAFEISNADQKANQIKVDSDYRARLAVLKIELDRTAKQNIQLQAAANHLLNLATPAAVHESSTYTYLNSKYCTFTKSPHPSTVDPEKPLELAFDDVGQEFSKLHQEMECQRKKLDRTLTWLKSLPTGMPVVGGRVTRAFGTEINSDTSKASHHDGVDFQVDREAAVITAGDGTVAKISKEGAYGSVIEILHEEGFMTRYARIRKISVSKGQKVKQGQKIAVVGGQIKNDHLHYEVYRHDTLLDPIQVLLPSRN